MTPNIRCGQICIYNIPHDTQPCIRNRTHTLTVVRNAPLASLTNDQRLRSARHARSHWPLPTGTAGQCHWASAPRAAPQRAAAGSTSTSTSSTLEPCFFVNVSYVSKTQRRSATQTKHVTYRLSVRPDIQRLRSIGPAPLEIRTGVVVGRAQLHAVPWHARTHSGGSPQRGGGYEEMYGGGYREAHAGGQSHARGGRTCRRARARALLGGDEGGGGEERAKRVGGRGGEDGGGVRRRASRASRRRRRRGRWRRRASRASRQRRRRGRRRR